MSFDQVRFCVRCGSPLMNKWQFEAWHPTCPECGWIYFPDPKVAAAALVEHEGRVLLTRRINEPQRGRWSFPAGFVDAGEDPARAAERECREETGLNVQVTALAEVLAGREHRRGADILIVYRAEIKGGTLAAGDDADQVGFFDRAQLPPLAFKTTYQLLGVPLPSDFQTEE